MKMAATASYSAVPSMLIVAPMGRQNLDQQGTNMTQDGTNMAQDATNMAQEVTKMAQDVSNIEQNVTNKSGALHYM